MVELTTQQIENFSASVKTKNNANQKFYEPSEICILLFLATANQIHASLWPDLQSLLMT